MSSYGDNVYAKDVMASQKVKTTKVDASGEVKCGSFTGPSQDTVPLEGQGAVGDIVFVVGHATATTNGVYIKTASGWSQCAQMNGSGA